MSILKGLCVLILLCIGSNLSAQELNKQEKNNTIEAVSRVLNESYIFPGIAEKIELHLAKKLKKGEYKTVSDPYLFAQELTKDVQSFNGDKHLRVLYEPERISREDQATTEQEENELEQHYLEDIKRNNYGFKELKILDGNIGYLNLSSFSDVAYGGATAEAAMQMFSSVGALIIDLRSNGGGSPRMVQLLCTYFFDNNPVHLNSFYRREENSTDQFWTLPYIKGERMPDVAIYILTSGGTFSAAEEFSYDLKHLNRAQLIGETTGGGAHPGGRIKATKNFNVWTPTGRAINPITKTNWEGVGVKPHIKSKNALETAHTKALDSLYKKATKKTDLDFYSWHSQNIKSKSNPITVSNNILQTYVGSYGMRSISLENGDLYYKRGKSSKRKLTPISESLFMVAGYTDFRLAFVTENNSVKSMLGKRINGSHNAYKKE